MIEWAMGMVQIKLFDYWSLLSFHYDHQNLLNQNNVISQHTPKHNFPHYQFYKSDDFEFNSMNSWKICTWLKLAGFMKIDFGRCWIVCWFRFVGNLSFQTVKIFLFKLSKFSFFKLSKFSFSNCQNFPFSNCQNFPFQTVKIFLYKLSKFSFSNCQNFPFQTVKIFPS